MKNTLIALVFLFSFQLHAQIPDSLGVDLPWDRVYMPSCDATMGEGPKTDNDGVSIFLDSDTLILDGEDECIIRSKLWIIVDWFGGEQYPYAQIGKMKDFANTQCVIDMVINYDDFPVVLNPESLLIDLNPSHEYAFSFSDDTYTNIVIDENSEESLELYVYDRTDSTVCKTNIYITKCEEDVSLVFPELVEIVFNQEPYIELDLDLLGVDIVYPCGPYTTVITVGNAGNSLLFAQKVGSIVPVKVVVEFSSGEKYIKYINVNVTGVKPPPISMFIEELTFSAGETIELDIWSEDVPGLIAWQLQLEFENVEILGLETSEMFDVIPFNANDENILKALWFPENGMSFDVESDATWFTLLLKPEIDGSTFDIFKTGQDPWSLIGIENDLYIYEYEADFIFNVAPRDLLNIEGGSVMENVIVYPNPSSKRIIIKGIEDSGKKVKIEIFDLNGKLIFQKFRSNINSEIGVDLSDLPSGLFVLTADNGKSIFTQKITRI